MQPEAPTGVAGKRQEIKPEERSGGDSSRYPRKVSRESWRRLKRYVGPYWKIRNPGRRRTVWITQAVFFIGSKLSKQTVKSKYIPIRGINFTLSEGYIYTVQLQKQTNNSNNAVYQASWIISRFFNSS